jgi:hypothetical protein
MPAFVCDAVADQERCIADGQPPQPLINPPPLRCVPSGVHPLPFHLVNVALHAAASALVAVLASKLFSRLEEWTERGGGGGGGAANDAATNGSREGDSAAVSPPAAAAAGVSADGLRQRRGGAAPGGAAKAEGSAAQQRPGGGGGDRPPGVWEMEGSWRVRVQSLLTGVLFAVHPIHTEVTA